MKKSHFFFLNILHLDWKESDANDRIVCIYIYIFFGSKPLNSSKFAYCINVGCGDTNTCLPLVRRLASAYSGSKHRRVNSVCGKITSFVSHIQQTVLYLKNKSTWNIATRRNELLSEQNLRNRPLNLYGNHFPPQL